ncbi:MAG: hypothetical protein GX804_00980, partial [Lentisphaerae bacterium]|nr:hypothetical protein [Lentisphaerota bacterium]
PFENIDLPGDEDVFYSSAFLNGLKVQNVWLIEESIRDDESIISEPRYNKAIMLPASPTGRGTVETTSLTSSEGRDTLKMRVRGSLRNEHLTYYKHGYAFGNYIVSAKAAVTSMSPDDPSISLYGYWQDPFNNIELRVTQMTHFRTSDPNRPYGYRLRLDMIQNKNGISTVLKSGYHGNTDANHKLTDSWTLKLNVKHTTSSSGTATGFLINGTGTDVVTLNETGFTIDSGFNMGGTVGVNVRDVGSAIELSMTDSAGNPGPYATFKSGGSSDWSLGGNQEGTLTPRWSFSTGTGGEPRLHKVFPDIKYRVNVYRDGVGNNNPIAPVPSFKGGEIVDWDENWDELGNNDNARTAGSYSYQNVEIPLKMWDDVFIQIKPEGSDGAIVVDDLSCDSWRGRTIFSPGPPVGETTENVWETTYAIARNDPSVDSMVYELTRSRANPAENQEMITPLLEAGIGDLLFNYKVVKGNVTFAVELLRTTGEVYGEPLMVTNVTAAMTPTYDRMYVAALTNMTGRFRIIIDPQLSSADGSILIDNVKVTDYPDVGDASWEAYNALISTYTWDTSIKFDGDANPEYRSASLNDEFDRDTPLGISYDDEQPYIQSPRISTGIGEVSFWYRSDPDPGNPGALPGKIHLIAAKNITDFANNPDALLTLTVDLLNPQSETYVEQVASLSGLQSINTNSWTKFSAEFYQADYKVLRIYGDTYNGARVMLDNIIVTEPVRTSIDIGSVRLIPEIPLFTDSVGIEVDLKNPRMNPYNIKVNLLYMVGTNVWGVNNWANSAYRVPLTKSDHSQYVFYASNAIPAMPIDSVVQYAVEVKYDGTFPSPVFFDGNTNDLTQAQFTNPSWYEPIDLNKQYASQGVSPYYFVFSVGTNTVFINEFLPNATYVTGPIGLGEQYVELIGPENANIAGWKQEQVAVANNVSAEKDIVIWTNVMKPGAAFTYRSIPADVPNEKGWGFYLLACPQVNSSNPSFSSPLQGYPIVIDQELFPPELYNADYSNFADLNNKIGLEVPGALCLRRSMGAYVHRLVWGGGTMLDALENRGYERLDNRGVSPAVRRNVYMWSQNTDPVNPALEFLLQTPDRYSPGYYNYGQTLLLWDVIPSEEDVGETPEVAVSVSGIEVGIGKATISFDVSTLNGVALTSQDGFTWYIETSGDPSFADVTAHEIVSAITADDDGTA